MPVSPPEVVSDLPDCLTSSAVRRSPGTVPRWRLAREGPFLSERSSSLLRCFGDGCAFPNMTYRPSDYVKLTGESDDYEFRRPRPVCPVSAGYGVKDSRTRPGTPGFPFGRGGCGCHGTPGPPCVCTDGGHRTVAALAGSGTHPLRNL